MQHSVVSEKVKAYITRYQHSKSLSRSRTEIRVTVGMSFQI